MFFPRAAAGPSGSSEPAGGAVAGRLILGGPDEGTDRVGCVGLGVDWGYTGLALGVAGLRARTHYLAVCLDEPTPSVNPSRQQS